jgi:RHS repeat-associated protein
VSFYGADGERLKTYQLTGGSYTATDRSIYFAGRLVWSQSSGSMFVDRLGSVRNGTRYYPYGEEQTATANDKDKFATYFRDNTTGLDYAVNRYYSSQQGRFTTRDPYLATLGDPQSWNRYAYVANDPINQTDPDGLVACGALQILGTGMSLAQAMNANTDVGLLGRLVWAESDHTWIRQGTLPYWYEQDAIAWTVVNRWRILNGFISIPGVRDYASLQWGPLGATISQIIGQDSPKQFATITGGPTNPHLTSNYQSQLDRVLKSEPSGANVVNIDLGELGVVSMTHGCYDVWQSWVAADFAIGGVSTDPFGSLGYTTSFHHTSINTTPLQPFFGNFGSENNFYGITSGTVNSDPGRELVRRKQALQRQEKRRRPF